MKGPIFAVIGVLTLFFGFSTFACATEQVQVGHEAAGTLFGDPVETTLAPGFHFVNPLVDWTHYDTRNKSQSFDDILVPAADQQKANIDISVQFRFLPGFSKEMLAGTGGPIEMIGVHFVPRTRSALRDAGRGVDRVEDFYSERVQQEFAASALAQLQDDLAPLGIEVQDVLVRDVTLPTVIAKAIEAKKQREQEVERERAELEVKRLEAERLVVSKQAEEKAAEAEANRIRTLAEAEASRITITSKATAEDIRRRSEAVTPEYVEYIRATRWNGAWPSTMLGGEGVVPFFNVTPTE